MAYDGLRHKLDCPEIFSQITGGKAFMLCSFIHKLLISQTLNTYAVKQEKYKSEKNSVYSPLQIASITYKSETTQLVLL